MRRMFIVFLLVLLPLRGWASDVMTLALVPGQGGTAAHALCPDHAASQDTAPLGDDGADASGEVHAHCTACQLPALSQPQAQAVAAVLTALPAPAVQIARVEPAPRRQIKPPIT